MKRLLTVLLIMVFTFGLFGCDNSPVIKKDNPVEVPPITDTDLINEVMDEIALDDIYNSDITLPTSGLNGVVIQWDTDSIYLTNDGKVTRPSLDVGNQTVTLTATFTLNDTFKVKTYEVILLANTEYTYQERIQFAVNEEDHRYLTIDELYSLFETSVETNFYKTETVLNMLYNNELKTYQNDSFILDWNSYETKDVNAIPVFVSEGLVYGSLGEMGQSKYFMSGIRMFHQTGGTDLYQDTELQINIISYLTETNDPLNSSLVILTTNNDFATYLLDNEIEHNFIITDDISLLDSGEYDLFIGNASTEEELKKVVSKEKPFMTFFHSWLLRSDAYDYLGIHLNFPQAVEVNQFDSVKELVKNTPNGLLLSSVNHMLYKEIDFDIDISSDCAVDTWVVSCDFSQIPYYETTFLNEFMLGVDKTKSNLRLIDFNAINVFDSDYNHLKYALLIADKLREDVSYPISWDEDTDKTAFFKAYFVDNLINYSRSNNPRQVNLGWFSPNEEEVQLLETIDRDVVISQNRDHTEVYTTGYYIKAGQTITVTRNDSSTTEVLLLINNDKDGTSRIYDGENSYFRPFEIKSNEIKILPGETVEFSTPHGGGLYIRLNDKDYDVDINLSLEDVIPYPVLRSLDDEAITAYTTFLEETPIPITDIITEYVHMHFEKSKLFDSIRYNSNQDIIDYVNDMDHYIIKENYKFAGFVDDTLLPLSQGVLDYCIQYDLDCENEEIHKRPIIQHININHVASCSKYCSGNPFDTGRVLNAFVFSANHEMGHNLQQNRLKFYGNKSSEVGVNLYPLNVYRQYALLNNQTTYKYRDNTEKTFDIINEAYINNTPSDIYHPLWSNTSTYGNSYERLMFYEQLMFAANNYDMYTIMHTTNRLIKEYQKTEESWLENRDQLGFSEYSMNDIRRISGNDYMIILASRLASKDLSVFAEGFGVSISELAQSQIDTYGFTESPLQAGIFYIELDEYDHRSIDIPTMDLFIELGEDAVYEDPTK